MRPELSITKGRLAHFAAALLCLALVAADDKPAARPAPAPPRSLFDGSTLEGWKPCYSKGGELKVVEGALTMPAGKPMTGIVTTRTDLPTVDYELSYEARRTAGTDFFAAATFPVNDSFVTLVNGGWGGNITGLSSINGADASENQTAAFFRYTNNTWHAFRIVVTGEAILCHVDDKPVVQLAHKDLKLSTRIETRATEPLGFATWNTAGALRKIQVRRLTEAEVTAADKVVKQLEDSK
jgi:hypothetical protein